MPIERFGPRPAGDPGRRRRTEPAAPARRASRINGAALLVLYRRRLRLPEGEIAAPAAASAGRAPICRSPNQHLRELLDQVRSRLAAGVRPSPPPATPSGGRRPASSSTRPSATSRAVRSCSLGGNPQKPNRLLTHAVEVNPDANALDPARRPRLANPALARGARLERLSRRPSCSRPAPRRGWRLANYWACRERAATSSAAASSASSPTDDGNSTSATP